MDMQILADPVPSRALDGQQDVYQCCSKWRSWIMKKLNSVLIIQYYLLVVFSCLSMLIPSAESFQSCPAICTCKWKTGKRWVECLSQGQISIPERIDIETQVLDLSGNNLQILPREVFSRRGLLNLQKLHLADCNIGQIDPTAFRGLTNLVELNLAGNLLTSVPTATFSDIPYLRVLHLNRNPIQKIEANAFEMIPQLVSLDLSKCEIKRVAAKAFSQIQDLEKLYINDNQIKELRQKTVETIADLHGIELSGNPWICDCRLLPLKEWLVTANVPYSNDPVCAAPESRLAGESFSSLSMDEFACPPELLSAPRYVEANAGENATITCKVGSVPKSRIRWYSMEGMVEILNNSVTNRGQQKYIITEVGSSEKTSTLTLTNVKTDDSGQFTCVSQNHAGKVEANFTLQVGYFVGGVASLESGEIVGIAATFGIIAGLMLIVALFFLIRQKACVDSGPFSTIWVRKEGQNESRPNQINNGNLNGTPGLEIHPKSNGQVVANGYHHQVEEEKQAKGTPATLIANGDPGFGNCQEVTLNGTVYNMEGTEKHPYSNPDIVPAENKYPVEFDRKYGALATLRRYSNGSVRGSPEGGVKTGDHNEYSTALCSPALLRKQRGNSSPVHDVRKIIRPIPSHALPPKTSNLLLANNQLRSDSFYPSSPAHGNTYNHKDQQQPRMYSPQLERASFSRPEISPFHSVHQTSPLVTNTLGRYQQGSNGIKSHYANAQQLFYEQQSRHQQQPVETFDYGYPSDYGLPLEPLQEGDEMVASPHQPSSLNGNLARNPLEDMFFNPETGSDNIGLIHPHPLPHQQHLMQQNPTYNISSADSSTLSPLRQSGGLTMSSGIGDASIESGESSNTAVMGYDHQDSTPINSSSGTGTPTPTSTSNITPQAQVRNGNAWGRDSQEKLRNGGRSRHRMFRNNRESPDEGIQDDVSTDV